MSGAPSLDAVFQLIHAARIVQTLQGTRELGLMRRLEQPASLEELAQHTGVATDRLQILLDALQAMELISRSGDRYESRVPRVMIDKMLGLRDIASALRGRPDWEGHTAAGANAHYPEVVGALSMMMREPADQAARLLAAPRLRILEVAAGACAWSLALAAHSPGSTVVVNDLPAVIEQSRQAVAAAGRSTQYDFLPGDLFSIDLGERRFDRVLVPMVVHLFDPETAARLVRRAASVLAPGGEVVMIDVFVQDDRPDLEASLYSLELLSRTAAGRVHRLSDANRWMDEAGLEASRVEVLPGRAGIRLVIGAYQPVAVT